MAAPAIEQVFDALVDRVSAIVPSLRPRTRFTRGPETTEAHEPTSRNPFRQFDVDVNSGSDDSNEGLGGVQNVGLADRRAVFLVSVSYPALARGEKAIEKVIGSDAELIMRAIGRSANWTSPPSAPVRRALCRWVVDRIALEVNGSLVLQVTVEVLYRDTE